MKRHHVLCTTAAATCVVHALPAGAQVQAFGGSARSAGSAIRDIARQVDWQFVSVRGSTRRMSADGLSVSLASNDRSNRLPQGTSLIARRTSQPIYALLAERGTPVPTVVASVPGASSTASEPSSPQGTTPSSQSGEPASDAQLPASDPSAAAPDVVVTGSRIARNGFSASTPVVVSDAKNVQLSGQIAVERALLELPQVALSNNSAFSLNLSGAGGGYSDLNLRGFGSNRNLVLVNGRRYAIINASQITDTNTIPASLIERTEIVTGGSSAVYGSDAITGVANFILKTNYDGVNARYQLNMIPASGTPSYNVDLTFGKNFAEGRGNIAVALNYFDRKGNLRDDFDWSRFTFSLGEGCIAAGSGTATTPGTRLAVPSGQTCQQAGGMIGYVFTGSNDIPNGRIFGTPTFGGSNAVLNAAYVSAGLTGVTSGDGFTFDNAGGSPRLYNSVRDSFNGTPFNSLQNPLRRKMVNAFGHFDISDKVTLYGEGHYSHNQTFVQIAPTNYNAPVLLNVNNPYLTPGVQSVLRALDAAETGTRTVTHGVTNFSTTPNDGLAAVSFGRRFVDAGTRQGTNTRDVYRGVAGFRGSLGSASENFLYGLKYDLYYSYAKASEDLIVENGISKSRFQQNILSVNGAAPVCNPFGQNLTAACVSAISADAFASNEATLQVAQGALTGTLLNMPAGPLGFSLGAEWRKTTASFVPAQNLFDGDVAGYNGTRPTSGSVNVKEAFGEVRVPLVHDTFLIKDLAANAGFRVSDYSLSGVGTVWTYFYGADWRVNTDLAFRGQYQRAIRAPSVGELYGGLTSSSSTINDPCSSRAATALQTADVRALCVATGVPANAVFTSAVQPAAFVYVQSGGNPKLDAEKADTYTAGAVFTPRFIPRLSASVDFFNISVDGAIAQLGGGTQNVFNLCYYVVRDASSEYCRAIPRSSISGEILDSNPARITNANTGGLRTRGIDFGVLYRLPLNTGFGLAETSSLDFRTNFTRLIKYTITPVQDLPVVNECVGAFGNTCGDAKPKWRGTTRVTWNVDALSLSLRHRYIGRVTNDRYLVPLRQGSASTPSLSTLAYPKVKAQNYFDLSFTLDAAERFQFYGGVNNLTNRDVPTTSSVGLYDPMGREIFLGASLNF